MGSAPGSWALRPRRPSVTRVRQGARRDITSMIPRRVPRNEGLTRVRACETASGYGVVTVKRFLPLRLASYIAASARVSSCAALGIGSVSGR